MNDVIPSFYNKNILPTRLNDLNVILETKIKELLDDNNIHNKNWRFLAEYIYQNDDLNSRHFF